MGTAICHGIIAEDEPRLASSTNTIRTLVGIWKEKRKADGAQYINVVKQTLVSQRDASYEDAFQTEMQQMRLHTKGLFTHTLPAPRIINDVTGTGDSKESP